jgi:hypothetical protein
MDSRELAQTRVRAGGGSIATGHTPSTLLEPSFSEAGTHCCTAMLPRLEGAQYSQHNCPVNDFPQPPFSAADWPDHAPAMKDRMGGRESFSRGPQGSHGPRSAPHWPACRAFPGGKWEYARRPRQPGHQRVGAHGAAAARPLCLAASVSGQPVRNSRAR